MDTPLNFHHLHLFCTVVECKSFSKAAQVLMMTQPAVSSQIKSLEQSLAAILLERTGRELQLTEAGAQVYDSAKKIIALEHGLRATVKELNSGQVGHVSIATNRPFGRYLLPKFLSRFIADHPRSDVSIQYADTRRICELVLDEVVDIGVVSSDDHQFKHSKLNIRFLHRDEWCLVTSARAPWTALPLLQVLEAAPLISSLEDSTNWRETKYILDSLELTEAQYHVRARLDDIESIKAMVAQGCGVAFLPRSCMEAQLSQAELVEIKLPLTSNPHLTFWLITKPRRQLRPTVEQFIQLLTSHFGP
ncbi:LysR family transcriptional regulator [Alicyclobacillus fastidiosus]|uniref:LysR family transcriptional regulator n=1 Tax=Alicyclobacillus fastidiosus TaxID=392011 RepID=A0ABV5ALK2_9BACL|nr:LysR family transcriptional regulator [Alicyclobacillus fastidiosus]WEH09379.1 LysR family transcriptional regulator [Alicyclobacillus fastidiosus]